MTFELLKNLGRPSARERLVRLTNCSPAPPHLKIHFLGRMVIKAGVSRLSARDPKKDSKGANSKTVLGKGRPAANDLASLERKMAFPNSFVKFHRVSAAQVEGETQHVHRSFSD